MTITASNDEITLAVDAVRALTRSRTYLPDRGTTRQFIATLAAALEMQENEVLLRLASYHQRHEEQLSNRLLDGM